MHGFIKLKLNTAPFANLFLLLMKEKGYFCKYNEKIFFIHIC
jgi:hypothetical protein